ncbi:MAG: excinuclease ABC subunit UvrA [Deltaproteobacteria bacterium]|nr:excinuclease ABC subunit UvrA [Deltaproteobacteria bacterium]
MVVRGAKEHNLKNISVSIPRETLTVITGLSGSGKSSLAFDTIFAEGQRRYVESLSTYARQFLEVLDKPEVESIDGLSPTISIQQKTTSHNPRSTVGTVTEVYDFMRLLFARVSQPFCYNCGKPISSQTAQQIVDRIMDLPEGSKLNILAPIVRGRKGEYQKELIAMRQKGFARARIDGEVLDLSRSFALDKQKKHDIDIYVDRLILRKNAPPPGPQAGASGIGRGFDSLRARLHDSVETALKLADGLLKISFEGAGPESERLFSDQFACMDCGISYPAPEPRTFSFNSPMGACKQCDGLGYFEDDLAAATASRAALEAEEETEALTVLAPCGACRGTRLKPESLYFKINDRSIAELSALSIGALADFFRDIALTERQLLISDRVLKEIRDRLAFLVHVGVDYLSLERPAQSLSGGESQRIRLATQIGSSLTGVTYVLDEPSVGLHQRDNGKLLETLERLRDIGNTVLVVEHDKDTIERADHVLDLGPGAGTHGGELVAQGAPADIKASSASLTGKYLAGNLKIEVPKTRRPISKSNLVHLSGITHHNLKNLDAGIPLGAFTCVTGVSGSGKSTLIVDTLYPLLMNGLYKTRMPPVTFRSISGHDSIDKVVDIDQSPIGRTPRSNPSTYTGTFGFIRDLFAQLPESRMRGFKPGRFSFNVKGGRCEKCQGAGRVKVEMHFLSDIYVACGECGEKRFNEETLTIKYRGKSIADALDMTIDDAAVFFENVPSLAAKLRTMADVGLGYITLGQSATTLSGGEAQRIKLARELSRRATGNTLYILDEPSTGLHFDDVRKLIHVLHRLTDQGNTVLVIEHNMEIIKTADYILDMGPEGGERGGKIIAEGTPEEVARNRESHTGRYLKPYL